MQSTGQLLDCIVGGHAVPPFFAGIEMFLVRIIEPFASHSPYGDQLSTVQFTGQLLVCIDGGHVLPYIAGANISRVLTIVPSESHAP